MRQLLGYFTLPYSNDPLNQQERAKTAAVFALLVIPSMLISLSLHIFDNMPAIVLLADAVFILASIVTLYFLRQKRLIWATYIFVLSFIFMIVCHNLVTDYLYESNLSYYRILETTIMFVFIMLSVSLMLQEGRLLLLSAFIGEMCIFAHYLIVVTKTDLNPFDSRPLSVLIAYAIMFLLLYVVTTRILKLHEKLLSTSEQKSEKIKNYNSELEKRVQERTGILERQNKELKKVNSELDRFVYSASHDLRAPLTSVLGLINLVRATTDRQQVDYYLGLQEQSIRRLDTFIHDIVNISRNSRTEIRRDEVHFGQLALSIFEQYSFMENAQLISKSVEIIQKDPFYTDEPRIKIILSNLFSNAIRYATPQRKKSFIRVSGEVSEQAAVLKIEDNGRGIASEHMSRIFEMFFRTDSNNKSGSGLGLYIVRETLDKLGGQISVDSALGKGTVFTLKIPSEVPCHSLSTTSNQ